jgi:hypothetical protein
MSSLATMAMIGSIVLPPVKVTRPSVSSKLRPAKPSVPRIS